MSNQHIDNICLIENTTILINFSQGWDQDDSELLSKLVLATIKNAKLVEQTQGADRHYFRFMFDNNYFLLHFEHYSYSCWIEAEDAVSALHIVDLYKQINEQLKMLK